MAVSNHSSGSSGGFMLASYETRIGCTAIGPPSLPVCSCRSRNTSGRRLLSRNIARDDRHLIRDGIHRAREIVVRHRASFDAATRRGATTACVRANPRGLCSRVGAES